MRFRFNSWSGKIKGTQGDGDTNYYKSFVGTEGAEKHRFVETSSRTSLQAGFFEGQEPISTNLAKDHFPNLIVTFA
jgi:hypothetical protein